jgi:RhoGEF domain
LKNKRKKKKKKKKQHLFFLCCNMEKASVRKKKRSTSTMSLPRVDQSMKRSGGKSKDKEKEKDVKSNRNNVVAALRKSGGRGSLRMAARKKRMSLFTHAKHIEEAIKVEEQLDNDNARASSSSVLSSSGQVAQLEAELRALKREAGEWRDRWIAQKEENNEIMTTFWAKTASAAACLPVVAASSQSSSVSSTHGHGVGGGAAAKKSVMSKVMGRKKKAASGRFMFSEAMINSLSSSDYAVTSDSGSASERGVGVALKGGDAVDGGDDADDASAVAAETPASPTSVPTLSFSSVRARADSDITAQSRRSRVRNSVQAELDRQEDEQAKAIARASLKKKKKQDRKDQHEKEKQDEKNVDGHVGDQDDGEDNVVDDKVDGGQDIYAEKPQVYIELGGSKDASKCVDDEPKAVVAPPPAVAVVDDESWRAEMEAMETKRGHVANEILKTEQNYGKVLSVLVEKYLLPLRRAVGTPKEVLDKQSVRTIFYQLEVIRGVNTLLLSKLEPRLADWDADVGLGDIFLSYAAMLRAYSLYINNYPSSLIVLDDVSKSNAAFKKFCRRRKGEWLSDLLIQPCQRVPQYIMLLQSLLDATHRRHPDRIPVLHALDKVKEIAEQNHRAQIQIENSMRMVQLEAQLGSKLLEGHRSFIDSASALVWDFKRQKARVRQLFLFSDMMIIAECLGTVDSADAPSASVAFSPHGTAAIGGVSSSSSSSSSSAASSSASAGGGEQDASSMQRRSLLDRYKVLERIPLITILRIIRDRSLIRALVADVRTLAENFARSMNLGGNDPIDEAERKMFILATYHLGPIIFCSVRKDIWVSQLNIYIAEAQDSIRSFATSHR